MESDPAYDWIGSVMPPVVIGIDQTLALDPLGDLHAGAKIRAAAYLLEQVGYEGVYPSATGLASRFDTESILLAHLHEAVAKLRIIRDDPAELESWVDPDKARTAIDRQIRALEKRIKDPSAPHAQTLLERLSGLPNPARAPNPVSSLYRRVATDAEVIMDNGARAQPLATLADAYGGRAQVLLDDHAYVVAIRDPVTGRYSWSTHVFPEAFLAICSLPVPNPTADLKARLLAYDFASR